MRVLSCQLDTYIQVMWNRYLNLVQREDYLAVEGQY